MTEPAIRNVVIVEDNPAFMGQIITAFDSIEGAWTIHPFEAGRAALQALSSGQLQPGLVLVDLGLPDMSGHEIIRVVRGRFPRTPVVVVSVLTGAEAVLEAIRLGARGYLQKGDTALSLRDGIRGVLAGEHPISPSLARYLFRLAQVSDITASASGTGLSSRELELLRLLGKGYTYDEAAERMRVTINTIRSYSQRIYLKLEVGSKREALAIARERGLM